jgi:hypothetical protein
VRGRRAADRRSRDVAAVSSCRREATESRLMSRFPIQLSVRSRHRHLLGGALALGVAVACTTSTETTGAEPAAAPPPAVRRARRARRASTGSTRASWTTRPNCSSPSW